ncbi:hypothetical protein ACFOWU_07050 [Epilithonimonas zeae]|uniref:Uncharacterized protein n=1 Tax=Epilithonimonas zeae TaxID=1416779 RepID=A0A1N6FU58_9FLAO|nr:hypothetical protein [Epilithonimonas zeae]SIN98788.1 hypothetical protein SAMN05444409_1479 [Epilithonimonas zeae]
MPKIFPFLHGCYYTLTSVWPLLHLDSFLNVTGGKTDIWLVRTVSIALLPYGLLSFYIAFSKRKSPIVALTCALCCFGLALVDAFYYMAGVIKWVYLIDAAIQMIFLLYWINYMFNYIHKTDKRIT